MICYTISEAAEGDLYKAEKTLSLLSFLFAAAGPAAAEVPGDELAAVLQLTQEMVARSRQAIQARLEPA